MAHSIRKGPRCALKYAFPRSRSIRISGKELKLSETCLCMQSNRYSVFIYLRLWTIGWSERFSLPARSCPYSKVCWRKISSAVWGNNSAQEIWVSALLALIPEPPTLDSVHTTLVHSAYSFARSQGECLHTKICALALSKGACISSHLPLLDSNPTIFYSQILCGYLFQFWCSGLGGLPWGIVPRVLNAIPPQLRYPSRTWSALCCSQASSFLPPHFQLVSMWFPLMSSR